MHQYLKKFKIFFFFFVFINISSNELRDYRIISSMFKDGLFDQSEKLSYQFLETYPQSTHINDVKYFLAISLLKQDRELLAAKYLEELAKVSNFKFYFDAIYYLSIIYNQNEKYKESNVYNDLAIDMALKNNDLKKLENLLIIGIENSINLKQEKKIKTYYDTFLEKFPQSKNKKTIYFMVNEYYFINEDYNNTIISCELIFADIKLSEEEKQIYDYRYLYSNYQLKKYDFCLEYFEKIKNKYDFNIYNLIANLYYNINKKEDAIELYIKIFEKEKEKDETLKDDTLIEKIATIYIELNKFQEAFDFLNKYSNENSFLYLKSYSLKNLGKTDLAFLTLSRKNFKNYTKEELLLYCELTFMLNDNTGYINIANNINMFENILNKDRKIILYNTLIYLYNNNNFLFANSVMNRWLKEFVDDSNYDSVLYMNGVTLMKLNKLDEAIIEFSKIQKLNKKDFLYYESFVDKGECYFEKQQYELAIKSYNTYLSNNVTNKRYKETLLQTGNAYFNLKNYDKAFNLYNEYRTKFGTTEKILNKISETLIKQANYKRIIDYFKNDKNINDYSFYVFIYSAFRIDDNKTILENIQNIDKYSQSKFFDEIIFVYLNLFLKQNRFQDFQNLLEKYNKNILSSQKEENLILSLKILLKQRKIDKAITLAEKIKNNYILAEIFNDFGYYKIAINYFNKIPEKNIDYFKINKFCLLSLINKDYNNLFKIIDTYSDKFNSMDFILYRIKAFFELKDKKSLIKLSKNLNNNKLVELINILVNYIEEENVKNILDKLSKLINNADLNSNITRFVINLIYIISIENNDFNIASNIINNIPQNRLNLFDAETRFNEAMIYKLSNNQEKAIDLWTRIFYLYPNEIFWIEKSIREIITLNPNHKIKELFENKYYLIEN